MLQPTREKLLYQVMVPVVAALLGVIAGAIFQLFTLDKAQPVDVMSLLKDPAFSPAQKLQALNAYKEITDRPWAIIRSLVGIFTFVVP